jgi:cell division GTPase FtsZ
MGTLGFYESDKKTTSLTSAIEGSLKPGGLLYPANVYEDAARAMIIIQGSREFLDVDEITKSVEKLSSKIGQVFKGIVIKKGRPKILSVFTLGQVPDLEMLYAQSAQAIQDEKGRKTRAKKQLDDAFAYIEDLEEVY